MCLRDMILIFHFCLLTKKKAFDQVGHGYLSVKRFVSFLKLFYTGASVIKVGEGLSYPVPVTRGIR